MSIKSDLVSAMQAYADGANDLDFEAAWGTTGRKIKNRGVTVDTGQGWDTVPGTIEAVLRAVASVLGNWVGDDYDLVLQNSITLSEEPISTGVLSIYRAGVLLRRVASPSSSSEYSWTVGARTVTFGSLITGWVHAQYLAVGS